MTKQFLLAIALATISGGASCESPADGQGLVVPEDAEIYGKFLDQWTRGAAQVIHVARAAEPPPAKEIAEFASCLKGYLLVGLTDPASSRQLSVTSLARRSIVRLVDPRTWKPRDPGPAIASGKLASKAVSDGFAAGLLTFSRIVFDEGHKVAIFEYSFVCGDLCGGGGGVIFDMTESRWKQRGMPCGGWVS